MKRFVRGIQVASILICTIVSFWSINQLATQFLSADRFAVCVKGSLSLQQISVIKNFLENNKEHSAMPLFALAKIVQERFPSLETISFFQDASGVITLQATTVEPMLMVDDTLVLTRDGKLFKRSLFDDHFLHSLQKISCPFIDEKCSFIDMQQSELVGQWSQDMVFVAKNFSDNLFELYDISCQDKASWWLQDKKQKNFFILFNGIGMPNEKVLAACNKIKEMLDARGEFKTKRVANWVADIRFEEQIILFRK